MFRMTSLIKPWGYKTYHQTKTRHIQDQDQRRKDKKAIRRWDCNITTKKLPLSMLKPITNTGRKAKP